MKIFFRKLDSRTLKPITKKNVRLIGQAVKAFEEFQSNSVVQKCKIDRNFVNKLLNENGVRQTKYVTEELPVEELPIEPKNDD